MVRTSLLTGQYTTRAANSTAPLGLLYLPSIPIIAPDVSLERWY
jgi:hypothetical protein